MNNNINILKPDDIKEELINAIRTHSLIPIIGSGFSAGLKAFSGEVTSGNIYKADMISILKETNQFSEEEIQEIESYSFSKVSSIYEDDIYVKPEKRFEYMKNHFYKVNLPELDSRRIVGEIDWPYIYTLNIDDCIERNTVFKKVILPNREILEDSFIDEKCVIKLHGDIGEIVSYRDAKKVFTSREYSLSINNNAELLYKFKNDMLNQNVVYIGCSLNDEFDLLSVDLLGKNKNEKTSARRTIFFTKGSVGKLSLSQYKQYGVTDVVEFDTYEQIYELLREVWDNAKKVREDELNELSAFSIRSIPVTEREENQEYFLWARELLDYSSSRFLIPSYFTSRDLSSSIIGKLKSNKLHLIRGQQFSGKSFLLVDLYVRIRDRKVYYINSTVRLTDNAITKLLSEEKVLVLIDSGAIDRQQLRRILLSVNSIHTNQSNFVICIPANGDMLNIYRLLKINKQLQERYILYWEINNKFNKNGKRQTSEFELINKKLSAINLPPITGDKTILDHLIYTEKQQNKDGKLSDIHLNLSDQKELAFLIALALRRQLNALDIISFEFDDIINTVEKKYMPFIERVDTLIPERDAADLSSYKYVLNSEFWICNELGEYASNPENKKKVVKAFRYIINAINRRYNYNVHKCKNCYRNYIMFDDINRIFVNKYHVNTHLIASIYDDLHSILADDFQFLHQEAKAWLNVSFVFSNKTDKKNALIKAFQTILTAKDSNINEIARSSSPKLEITLAHIQYTMALIQCEICKVNHYKNMDEIDKAIELLFIALYSPYNIDEGKISQNNSTQSRWLKEFLTKLITTEISNDLSEDNKNKLNALISKEGVILNKPL